jgi:ABC-type Fe3+-siderophore transport system permease subunit
MIINAENKTFNFTIDAPPSKSLYHRELIIRFLCGDYSNLEIMANDGEDVRATKIILQILHNTITETDMGTHPENIGRRRTLYIPCNESGSTLRFMIPVTAALLLASAIDRSISNTTVVLIGMVLSLFVNGILNLLSSLYSDHSKQLYLWMMGSFSARGWKHCAILFPVLVICFVLLMTMARKMDIMSFGDLQAQAMGVDAKKTKIIAILICSLLTGVSVAFTGVIGFVDLAAPHIVRKIFGPAHKIVIPMSFIYGGAFMALCDLISRTLLSPREIPVGAVTALLGAPFFAYVFFASRRKR